MKTLLFSLLLVFLGPTLFAHAHSDSAQAHPTPPAMVHLKFANNTFHAHATWTKGPQVGEESRLQLEWKRASDHAPAEPPGTVKVVLWMPDMGHGSAPTRIQTVPDERGHARTGAYQVTDMHFIMSGRWHVYITLTSPDGTEETKTIVIDLGDEPSDDRPDDHSGDHGPSSPHRH